LSFDDEGSILDVPSCVVSSAASEPAGAQLSLIFPKSYQKAPIAVLALGSDLGPALRVDMNLSSSQTQVALPLGSGAADGVATFWQIPIDFEYLLERIENASSLKLTVYFADSTQVLEISLKGSMMTFDANREKCFQGAELFSKDFFEKIGDPSVLPVPVESPTVENMLKVFQSAYLTFLKVSSLSQSLLDLDVKNKEEVERVQSIDQALDEAQNRSNSLVSRLKSLSLEKSQGEMKGQELQKVLGSLGTELERSKGALNLKKSTFRTLELKLEELTKDFLNKEASRLNLIEKVQVTEAQLESGRATLSLLNEKVTDLATQKQQKQSTLELKSVEKADWAQRLSSFDYSGLVTQRISGSEDYSRIESEVAALRVSFSEREAATKERQVAQLNEQKRFTNCLEATSDAGSCAAERRALVEAQVLFTKTHRESIGINDQISEKKSQLRAIKDGIESQVSAERRSIQSEFDRLTSEVSALVAEIASLESSVQQLQNEIIPSGTNRVKELQAELSSLVSRRDQAETAAREAAQSKKAYEESDEYVNAKNAVEVNRATYEKVNAEFEAKQSEFAQNKSRLEQLGVELPKVESDLTQSNEVVDKASADLKLAQSGLTAYYESQKPMKSQMKALEADLEKQLGEYRYMMFSLMY